MLRKLTVCDRDLGFVQVRLSTVVGIPAGGIGRGTILHSPRMRGDRNVVSGGFPPLKLELWLLEVFKYLDCSWIPTRWAGIGASGRTGIQVKTEPPIGVFGWDGRRVVTARNAITHDTSQVHIGIRRWSKEGDCDRPKT